jgi:outer membrane receptor for Fe3+-dicitrate
MLDQITISNEVNTFHTLSSIDLETNPVNSSQEILRRVPGLMIGQHAGGGKAEQIFLRGFDIDHGTDINISVDGLPVNLVSHAHGQGYADMHFIMPEIVDKITYGKGPYDTHIGNLATAGYVALKTKDNPENSFITAEYGLFNTKRTAGLIKLLSSPAESAYIATEFLSSDGPFESSQAFNRLNVFAKYTKNFKNDDRLSVWVSHFTSRWNASGQIPDRAVQQGLISRFGAIDDTEGGNTSRNNMVLQYTKKLKNGNFIKTRSYMSTNKFLLFSNFTFFLADSINGDQIRQNENRSLYGLDSELNYKLKFISNNLMLRLGTGIRYDDINKIELAATANRKTTLNELASGQIDESNFQMYGDLTYTWGKFNVNAGIRRDYFHFMYENDLNPVYQLLEEKKSIFSPKVNIQYAFRNNIQVFARLGKGFHSNDTRVVLEQRAQQILPGAYGMDVGGVFKPFPDIIINAAFWTLYMDQEFVYVGDGGIVEPGDRSKRYGLDLGIRYQPLPWLFIYSDLNLANARSIGIEGSQYIPLAPVITNTGGLSFQFRNNISGGLRYRYMGNRPANEDFSLIAEGYTIVDFNINWTFKNMNVGIDVNNIFNTEWKETQFATESRLKNETVPVEEIHFTPGFPFYVKGKISYLF